jgi:methyl-accepting chemotaxis protein
MNRDNAGAVWTLRATRQSAGTGGRATRPVATLLALGGRLNLRAMGIGARLGASFAAVLALLALVVVASTFLVERNKQALKAGLQAANLKGELVVDMKSALLQSGIAMRNMLDISTVQQQKARVDAQNRLRDAALRQLLELDLSEREMAILASLAAIETSIESKYRMAINQAENLNADGAAAVITRFIDPMNVKAVAEIDQLLALQRAAAHQLMTDSELADRSLAKVLLAITTVAILLGVVVSWCITRSITGPLKRAVDLATAVAAGDLTTAIDDRHRDEIGQLLRALARMNDSLRGIIGDVRGTTDTVGAMSLDLSASSANLSTRTESQAASLEETAAAMEQLTATVRQNAASARQGNSLVRSASLVAARGGGAVGEVVEVIALIKQSSNKVADIIGVIDRIAFQTNILALNAAVEAAGAGEQGRGFAVVAGEVRSLAQRSALAAREIKSLIDDSVAKVDAGNALAIQAGATMEQVVASVRDITGVMAEILAATEEQGAGIEQVNRAIIQMDAVTQENAALVQEAALAAQTMREHAVLLAGTVGVFTLGQAMPAFGAQADR